MLKTYRIHEIADLWGLLDCHVATPVIKGSFVAWAKTVEAVYELDHSRHPTSVTMNSEAMERVKYFALLNSELARFGRKVDIAELISCVGLDGIIQKHDWSGLLEWSQNCPVSFHLRDKVTVVISFEEQQKLKEFLREKLKRSRDEALKGFLSTTLPAADQLRQIANDLEASQTHLDLLQELKAEMQSIKDKLDAALEKLGKL